MFVSFLFEINIKELWAQNVVLCFSSRPLFRLSFPSFLNPTPSLCMQLTHPPSSASPFSPVSPAATLSAADLLQHLMVLTFSSSSEQSFQFIHMTAVV